MYGDRNIFVVIAIAIMAMLVISTARYRGACIRSLNPKPHLVLWMLCPNVSSFFKPFTKRRSTVAQREVTTHKSNEVSCGPARVKGMYVLENNRIYALTGEISAVKCYGNWIPSPTVPKCELFIPPAHTPLHDSYLGVT